MAGFFQVGISFSSVEQIEELILRRYHDINYILSMSPSRFLRFLHTAIEKEKEETYFSEWINLYPHMAMGLIKFISFNEYVDARTGRNIDMRPTEEIIAEIEELHRKKVEG